MVAYVTRVPCFSRDQREVRRNSAKTHSVRYPSGSAWSRTRSMTTGVPGLTPARASSSSSDSTHVSSGRKFGGADGLPPESTVSHLSPKTPQFPDVNSTTITPHMSTEVVLHELAHHLEPDNSDFSSHGGQFVDRFVTLVSEVIGQEAGFVLRATMHQTGVEFA